MWSLYCYDDGETPDIWDRWFSDRLVTSAVRARHAVVWKILRQMLVWTDYNLVHDSPVGGVKEVRILVKKDLQWRLGGVYGPNQREFTVLGAFYHKAQRYYPKAALSEIERRRDALEAGHFKKRKLREPPRVIVGA